MIPVMTDFLYSPVVNNLAAALIHSVWQAGLVYLLLRLSNSFLTSLNSEFRYGLALGAMAIFFIINGLTYGLLAAEHYETGTELLGAWSNLNLTGLSTRGMPAVAEEFSLTALSPYFIMFWWLGIVLFAVRFSLNLYRSHRMTIDGLLDPPEKISTLFAKLTQRLSLTKKAKLYLSEKVFSPAVIGVFKPVILLPVGLVNGLTTDEVEAILIHEMNHIRRYDYLVNIVQSLLEVIYFFNPFVWLISNEIREQRENVCDDRTLAMGISRRSYAEMLANIYEFAYYRSHLAISFAERKKLTLKRIRRIMKTQSNNSRLFSSLVLIFVVSLAIYVGAEAPLPTENIPFYSPERIQVASPLGSLTPQNTSEFMSRLEASLNSQVPQVKPVIVQDTIDEKAIEQKARELEQEMEKLHSSKEWQEFEELREKMIEQQMKLMEEFKPQLDEAMKSVDWTIKMEELQMQELQEKISRLNHELHEMEFDEEMVRAMEQSARLIEESMAQVEAQMESIHAAELQEMAQQYAAQALESAASAEAIAREAEKAAAEAMKIAKKVEVFMKELKTQLVEDGYINDKEDIKELSFKDGKVIVNGKEVKEKDAKKYNQLRKKYLGEDSKFFMN